MTKANGVTKIVIPREDWEYDKATIDAVHTAREEFKLGRYITLPKPRIVGGGENEEKR